jgi:proton-dependent oligopeptide transporter, POT family
MTALASEVETAEKLGFGATIKTFPRSFWMGCGIEMWERLAYYGTRQVVGLYIAQASDPLGLHFTQADKGTIFFWWALVQSLVPMVSGGFSDRYGYKKTIVCSTLLAATGYVLMGTQRSFGGFFAGCLVLALGTAIFKPGIQGTLAQSMSKRNSSVGWGLFYWLVNVGSFIGPLFAAFMRSQGWRFVFFGSACVICLNLVMLFTYPHVDSGADKNKKIGRVAIDTFWNFFGSPRLMLVVVLFSGFWMLLYQLWDLAPNFYTDWIDSIGFVKSNTWLPAKWLDTHDLRGTQLKQEVALNLNALMVVTFVVPMSFLVSRIRVMTSISIGVLVTTCGTIVYGTSPSIYVLFFGIVLFSLGEMLTGPKKTEYFSLIAPKGKKALYLGYVNIPVAIGQAVGAKIAGWQYGQYGEKATLALRYLAEKTDLLQGRAWNGDVTMLEAVTGIERKAAFETLVKTLGRDANDVNQLLWTTYRPYQVWYPFVIIGFCSLFGIVVFSQVSKRWKDMNV